MKNLIEMYPLFKHFKWEPEEDTPCCGPLID